jgi:P27 family predicted phage terminase small subunit
MPKTTDKPPLAVVTSAMTGIAPPRQLGRHGMQFWEQVQREYAIQDAAGLELLMQCCSAIDRAESLAEIIAREGEVIRTRTGTIKSHPAVRDELSARQVVMRAISKLGIDSEPVKSPGRPPRSFGWRGDE